MIHTILRLIFALISFEVFSAISKLQEGPFTSVIETDPLDRIIRLEDSSHQLEYVYDDNSKIQKIYKDGLCLIEYIRKDPRWDLLIQSKDHEYWFKKTAGRYDYGDLKTGASGYRLYDDQKRCVFEKFLHGISVEYTYTENGKITHVIGQGWFGWHKEGGSYFFDGSKIDSCSYQKEPISHILKKDENKNIVDYVCLDSLVRFSYDEKDQLIEEVRGENVIRYKYGEAYTRLESDNNPYKELEIDDLGRVVRFVQDQAELDFFYDPFGRILKIMENGGDELLLIYDGSHEIGTIFKKGILDFRMVESIPDQPNPGTLFIYQNGKGFFVDQDLFGNIILLKDHKTKKVKELITYSGFSEIERKNRPISPWRYGGKRFLEKISLSIFDHRFYDPEAGKFLSVDPMGYDLSLNRRHFCLNNPIKYCDPDGRLLRVRFPQADKYLLGQITDFVGKHLPIPLLWGLRLRHFGADLMGVDPPEDFDVDHVFCVQEALKDEERSIVFVNGICTPKPIAEFICYELSEMLQQKISCVHLATEGFGRDIINAVKEFLGFKTRGSRLIENYIQTLLQNPDKKIVIILHSRGALTTSLALKDLTDEQRERIEIYSFGAAWLIPKWMGKRVINFVSKADLVPMIDFSGIMRDGYYREAAIVRLDIEEGSSHLFDHSFLGATYKKALSNLVKEYLTKYPDQNEA